MSLTPTIYDSAPELGRDPSESYYQHVRDEYRAHKQRLDPNHNGGLLAPLFESGKRVLGVGVAALALGYSLYNGQEIARGADHQMDRIGHFFAGTNPHAPQYNIHNVPHRSINK